MYGKIEQTSEYIKITQHHDTPASYKIYPSREIIVTTWLDEANHDFIIMSEDDFDLETDNSHQPDQYQLGVKTKDQIQELFYELGTALFPRNHIFHRQGKEDMGDDPIFFWGNKAFLDLNQIKKS